MSESQETASEPSRVTSITLDECAALGQSLRIDLGARRTVLVGANAAGKSAILEAIGHGLDNPFMHVLVGVPDEPRKFQISIDTTNGPVAYGYAWRPGQTSSGAPRAALADWSETLSLSGDIAWRLEDGKAHWLGRETGVPPMQAVSILINPASVLPPEVSLAPVGRVSNDAAARLALKSVAVACQSSQRVRAGVPRTAGNRNPLSFLMDGDGKRWQPTTSERSRIVRMFMDMLAKRASDPSAFKEFVSICVRIRLFDAFDFVEYSQLGSPAAGTLGAFIGDDVNAGLFSDGTLRVMEILWALLETPPGALLTIEEPETGIHPGLLAALFNEIDAYLGDRQVIISTHSPTVVDRVSPNELRLVSRAHGKTSIDRISGATMQELRTYLHSQGELGEFVFEGGLQ